MGVEFKSMAQGICELLWLRSLMKKLKIANGGFTRLYYDKKETISIAHNLIQHYKTKHIEMDQHFIKENLDNDLICIPFISMTFHYRRKNIEGLCRGSYVDFIEKIMLLPCVNET